MGVLPAILEAANPVHEMNVQSCLGRASYSFSSIQCACLPEEARTYPRS